MAVELTEDEKTKFQEHLKELGYDDHASKVIERVNGEAKTHREAKEQLEKELKALKEAEEKRVKDEEKREADEAAKRKQLEDEQKSAEERALDERLKKIDEKLEERIAKERALSNKEVDKLQEELSARDKRILEQAIRTAAIKRGIIDEDLVRLIDASKVPVEGGQPDTEAIEELIEEHAKAKPLLYQDTPPQSQQQRDDNGRFTERPRPKNGAADVDASKLSDKEFEELEARLRQART